MIEWIYTIDPTADEPAMLISKHIGADDMGVDGAQFQKELYTLKAMGKTNIMVYINSVGGSVIDGMSIYDAILESGANTCAVGIVASIAAVFFQAGKKRYMADYSSLMFHNPYSESGDVDDDTLNVMKKSLITMISSRSNVDPLIVEEMMNRTTWILPEEAIANGLADEMIKSSSYEKASVISKNDAIAKWNQANLIINKFIEKRTNKIVNKQKKSNIMSEKQERIIKALETIANKAEMSEDLEMDNKIIENKIVENDFESQYKEMKAKYDECMNKLAEVENEMNIRNEEIRNAEIKNKEDKAKEMVNSFVSIGKIKNDEITIARWRALAEIDFENAKAMLEDIPVNKISNKLEDNKTPIQNPALIGPGAIGKRMQELMDKNRHIK